MGVAADENGRREPTRGRRREGASSPSAETRPRGGSIERSPAPRCLRRRCPRRRCPRRGEDSLLSGNAQRLPRVPALRRPGSSSRNEPTGAGQAPPDEQPAPPNPWRLSRGRRQPPAWGVVPAATRSAPRSRARAANPRGQPRPVRTAGAMCIKRNNLIKRHLPSTPRRATSLLVLPVPPARDALRSRRPTEASEVKAWREQGKGEAPRAPAERHGVVVRAVVDGALAGRSHVGGALAAGAILRRGPSPGRCCCRCWLGPWGASSTGIPKPARVTARRGIGSTAKCSRPSTTVKPA